MLWEMNFEDSSIHLAVEGSCGGTSFGLHVARQAILKGGRVLWVAPEMPDVSPTESSRFHAMNLVGNVDQAIDSLLKTARALPNVSLVVLDDYCPDSGQIPKDIVSAVNKLISDTSWTTLLISKGGVSMDSNPLVARGKNKLNANEVWLLTRPNSDSKRTLWIGDEPTELRLDEDGFVH